MMNGWQNQLARCLKLGVSEVELRIHLDEMVSWYSRLSRGSDEFAASLISEYGEQGFKQRFEEFLDRLVVADNKGQRLFPQELSDAQAKKRYRQLIRVFHPDRGAKDEVWLNYRAEIINANYEKYCNRESLVPPDLRSNGAPGPAHTTDFGRTPRSGNGSSHGNRTARGKVTARASRNLKIKFRPAVWRRRLGDPKTLQRKIVYSLALFSAVLVLFFYASTREPAESIAQALATENTPSSEAMDTQEPAVSEQLSAENQRLVDDAPWLDFDIQESDTSILDDILTASESLDSQSLSEPQSDLQASTVVQELRPRKEAEPIALAAMTEANPMPAAVKAQPRIPAKPKPAKSIVRSRPVSDQNEKNIKASAAPKPVAQTEPKRQQGKIMARPSPAVVGNQVPDNCAEPLKGSSFTKPVSGQVTATALLVRAGPSQECENVGSFQRDARVQLLRCDKIGYWCYIKADAESESALSGWVSQRHIVRTVAIIPDVKTDAKSGSELPDLVSQKYIVQTEVIIPAIKSMLQRYKRYFKEGDAIGLAELYSTEARENKLRGKAKIRRDYQQFFKVTNSRSLEIEVSNIVEQDEFGAILEGIMATRSRNYANGQTRSGESSFKLVIVKTNDAFKITSFDWKLIKESVLR